MSSSILKLYKYKSVKEISIVLSELFIDTILKSTFKNNLQNTLLIPVPISNMRKNERGFNQMEYITLEVGRRLQLKSNTNMINCKNLAEHQAKKNRLERYKSMKNPFFINKHACPDLNLYDSITLVDDVITTGNTLEKITQVIRTSYGTNIVVNALCMFRGKPYFLSTEQHQQYPSQLSH